ncbi:hypothetical protein J3F84DRAFT_388061 [Trichoderma pleuroticola]
MSAASRLLKLVAILFYTKPHVAHHLSPRLHSWNASHGVLCPPSVATPESSYTPRIHQGCPVKRMSFGQLCRT